MVKNKKLSNNISFEDLNLVNNNKYKIFNTDLLVAIDELDETKTFDELKEEKLNELFPKNKCYNPLYENVVLGNYTNYVFCNSYHSEIDANGVWDKNCEKDEECPFFQANKNYPNDFGGCKKGICELPIGMSSIGGIKVNKISVPQCYNCDNYINVDNNEVKNDNKCCYKQNRDKKLKSPDYMFEGDKQLRYKHREYLEKVGLKV